MMLIPPSSTLFPYTTLFRSGHRCRRPGDRLPVRPVQADHQPVRVRCAHRQGDRKSTRLNSSHVAISYAVFCLKKKKLKIKYPHSDLFKIYTIWKENYVMDK